MKQRFRLLITPPLSPQINMAIDEAVFFTHVDGNTPPTLRLYQWKQPALSLGRFQDEKKEIDLEACSQHNIIPVRRPTGGRAVLHIDEFTYSVTISTRYGAPSGVIPAYTWLAQGIIKGFASLGISLSVSLGGVSKNPSAACFASTTQADLVVNGRKIIGSAQRWIGDTVLQQGSIPLNDQSHILYKVLTAVNEEQRQQSIAAYRSQVISIFELSKDISREQISQAFIDGFTDAFDAEFQVDTLNYNEIAIAKKLAEEKYAFLNWSNITS